MEIISREAVNGKVKVVARLNSGKIVTTINGKVQHYDADLKVETNAKS